MERSVKRQKLTSQEKDVLEKKTVLELEQAAAEAMMGAYQQKMALISEKRKEIEKEKKKLAFRLKSHDERVLKNTIAIVFVCL